MLIVMAVVGLMFVGVIVRYHGTETRSVKHAVLGSAMFLVPAVACSVLSVFYGSYWWATLGAGIVVWNIYEFIKFYRTEARK